MPWIAPVLDIEVPAHGVGMAPLCSSPSYIDICLLHIGTNRLFYVPITGVQNTNFVQFNFLTSEVRTVFRGVIKFVASPLIKLKQLAQKR
jgi:hypothetical protein